MSMHSCIQKLCSKTLGKHVCIDRNVTLAWLLVTACAEFIDLHGQQICLSGVRGLSWCAVVCFSLSAPFRKSSCLISNSSNIDDEFGMFA